MPNLSFTTYEGGNTTINAAEAAGGFQIGGTAEVGSTLKINGILVPVSSAGKWSTTLAAPPDGNWTVTATQTNPTGKITNLSKAFTVDTTPPVVAITSIEGGNTTINAAEAANGITISGTATPLASLSVNGKSTVADRNGNWTVTLSTPSSDGPLAVNAVITDSAGNVGRSSVTLDVHAKPPLAAITSIEGGNTAITAAEAAGGVVISGTATAGSTLKLNGVNVVVDGTGKWTTSLNPPGDGNWLLTAVASDAYGNSTTATKALTVDATPPTVAITSIEGGNTTITAAEAAGGITIGGTATGGTSLKVNGTSVTPAANGNWSVTLSTPSSDGAFVVNAVSTDAVGNTATSSVTLDVHAKPLAVAITTIEGGDTTITAAEAAGGVIIGGTATPGSTLKLNGVNVVVDGTGKWTTSLNPPGDGNWLLTAVASDAYGNSTTATKALTVDATPPTVAITSIEGGNTTITAAEAAGGITIGGTATGGTSLKVNGTSVTPAANGNWSVTLSTPSSDGAFVVNAVSTDAVGNTATSSVTLDVHARPPVVAITTIEGGDTTITAAEAAGGVIIGGTATPGSTLKLNGVDVVVDGTGKWTTSLAAPANGNWLLTAVASDAYGNSGTATKALTVNASLPRVAITGYEGGDKVINAAEAAGGIQVSGTAEYGVALTVNNRSVAVDNTGHWTTLVDAPTGDGNFNVTAIARSGFSNVYTATDTVLVDTTGPAIAVTTIEGGNPVISASEAAGGIQIGGTAEIGSTLNVNGSAVTVDTGGHWSTVVTAPASEGVFNVVATGHDTAGNTTVTTKALTLDTTAPVVAFTTIEGGNDTITKTELKNGIQIGGTTEIGSTLTINGAAVAVDGTGHWATTLASPTANGILNVTAVATDAAGNTGSSAQKLYVNTDNHFDVRDFGATADDGTVDSAAINAAIRACHEAGGGTVYIPAGTFWVEGDHTNPSLGAIELLSNVHLQGAGMGLTVLKLVDGFNDRINGIVRTTLGEEGEHVSNITLSDLTIDGNRENNMGPLGDGHQAAFITGAKEDGSGRIQSDILVDNVEAMNCTAYGFDPHEVTYRITIQNSVAHNNGLDGFTGDALIDSDFSNNIAYANDRHGFNIQNATSNFYLVDNIAYGNGTGATGGSGLTLQRGNIISEYPIGGQDTIVNNHIFVIGGEYYDNSRSGILVKLSDTVTIDGADIYGNAREGIRVEGSTNTVIMNNEIHDNSTESPGAYDAINIRVRDDALFKEIVNSTGTSIHDNDIYATTSPSRYGIREEVTNTPLPDGSPSGTTLTNETDTTSSDNHISGMRNGDISVPGYFETLTGTPNGDTLTGSNGADHIDGLGGDDLLFGFQGTDTIVGGPGNDTIDGGTEADSMAGGIGNDVYYVDHSLDIVTELAAQGIDSVVSTITYTLVDNVENLTLVGTELRNGYGNELDNVLIGNAASNVLKAYDGNDTLDGGGGADQMTGGHGDDTYYVDQADDQIFESDDAGLGGYDRVFSAVSYTLPSQVEEITLTGGANIDATGSSQANTLNGNSGNNILDGGLNADTMAGGLGDDTYVVDNTGDVVIELPGGGTDLVRSSLSYTLTGNVENLTLANALDVNGVVLNLNGTGNGLDNVLTGNDGGNKLDGGIGADTMIGGRGDDTYYVDNAGDQIVEIDDGGLGGRDKVYSGVSFALGPQVEDLELTGTGNIDATGNALNNALKGNDGNNVLDGGIGADTMTGGLGDDTYIVGNVGDLVSESVGGGTDLVKSAITYTLTGNVENLTLLPGAGNINGTGNSLANSLVGNEGNNVLDGGTNADAMAGGLGDDTYVIDHTGDVVIELPGGGTDLVMSSLSYTLGDNLENLTLTGLLDLNGTGNGLDNVLTGNDGGNKLDGGIGADTMIGGRGADTYYVDNAGDQIVEIDDGGLGGRDKVYSGVSFALGPQVEDLELTGTGNIDGTGNELANVLKGNDGNNVLDGGIGADTMSGGLGNDTYMVDAGDLVSESAGGGTDLVQSTVTYTLTGNVENLTLLGSDTLGGTGNGLDNVILGNGAANALSGLDGNDTLDGGAGADVMTGGDGNDTYYVDNVDDQIVETANLGLGGSDKVYSSVSYTLAAQVEDLQLTGTDDLNATGNGLANSLTGNDGGNVLDGGTNADAMAGGLGDDTYVVENTGDAVIELSGGGTDLVQSAISYTLTDNVENLTLTGLLDLNGTGNGLDNVLTGNDGGNKLDGGIGADTMIGGRGDDTYYVDNAGDQIVEIDDGGLGGRDKVYSGVSFALGPQVEDLELTGTGNIDATGNALNNALKGNDGNNVLDGGIGADTMTGGLGDDTYIVGNVGDLVSESVGGGTDLVKSAITYTLTGNVENLTLLPGAGNINGTGNSLANSLVGNEGNNVLDGGTNADAMAGGLGDDTYVIDHTGDVVIELPGGGTDLVMSSLSYTLGDNLENLTLTGLLDLNGTGNGLDNVLTGNDGGNKLDGGIGADTMIGGRGADTYYVDNAGDQIVEIDDGGLGGRDKVYSGVSFALGPQVEDLELTGTGNIDGTGNELANVLKGNDGNNVLDGGIGADTMSGGLGNDTYMVDAGDLVSESAGGGTDLVQSTVTYTLTGNVENLTLLGSDTLGGTGNGLDNVILGNGAANALSGLDGNDTLDGGAGADVMTGGRGDDVYHVDNINDQIVELTDGGLGGHDSVFSSVSYTLSSQVEDLQLTGTDDLNATGNGLANILIGNDGNNVLDGGSSGDTMIGGLGNDTYVVGQTTDIVTEAADGGTDLVQSAITYTLGANVENLTLTGSGPINATGNALDNAITGNDGANKIEGGLGHDFMFGGGGADTFVFKTLADSAAGAATRDVIDDFAPGSDKISLVAISDDPLTVATEHFTWGGQSQQAQLNKVTWFDDGAGHAIVQTDTTGDGVADLEIQLNNWDALKTLNASDFIL